MQENREEEEEEETPIRGDLLELVLSFVPLIHLLSVCRVSKSWRRAVFSSLTNSNSNAALKPWLFVHTQSTYSLESRSSHAFDPRSNLWIEIHKPPIRHVKALKSSGSNFLYVLSSSRLLLSKDRFNLKWTQFQGPNVCRDNPIVALCGDRIVVAGSCWEIEENEQLAVEVYDPDLSTWRACQPMPDTLKNADGATWLSVAADQSQMFVTEKATGITYSFDPCAGKWWGPYDLRPDPRAFFTTVGFAGEDLIVASLIGEAGHVESVRLSKLDRGTMTCDPICDAPDLILEKLKGNKAVLHQIGISPEKEFVYLYNPWEQEEMAFCDFSGSGEECVCVWGSTRNVAWNVDVKIGEKMVFTCGRVEIEDIDVAMRSGDLKFR